MQGFVVQMVQCRFRTSRTTHRCRSHFYLQRLAQGVRPRRHGGLFWNNRLRAVLGVSRVVYRTYRRHCCIARHLYSRCRGASRDYNARRKLQDSCNSANAHRARISTLFNHRAQSRGRRQVLALTR